MPWSVEYESKLGIIHSVYSGRVTANDFKEGTIRTISLAKSHKTNLLLSDNSKLESAVSTREIYEMPQFYDDIHASRVSRLALILPPFGQIREDVKFYETVCQNRGWAVKVFNKRQAAVDWLLHKPGSSRTEAGDD